LQQKVNHPVIYPAKNCQNSEGILSLNILQCVYNKHILILKGNNGRLLLEKSLIQRGAIVRNCECYIRQYIDYPKDKLINLWKNKGITTIVASSNEILVRLTELTPLQEKAWLFSRRLIVVSERLAVKAKQLGWQTIFTAPSAQ